LIRAIKLLSQTAAPIVDNTAVDNFVHK